MEAPGCKSWCTKCPILCCSLHSNNVAFYHFLKRISRSQAFPHWSPFHQPQMLDHHSPPESYLSFKHLLSYYLLRHDFPDFINYIRISRVLTYQRCTLPTDHFKSLLYILALFKANNVSCLSHFSLSSKRASSLLFSTVSPLLRTVLVTW